MKFFNHLQILKLAFVFIAFNTIVSEDLQDQNKITLNISDKDKPQRAKMDIWETVLWDDFDQFDFSKWSKTNREDYNSSRCRYLPEQVFTASDNGTSVLILKAEKWNDTKWKSGHVKSKQQFRPENNQEIWFKARIKFNSFNPDGSWRPFHDTYGAWPAFWTTEENGWPTKGEIDIMEGYTYGKSKNDKWASNLFFGWENGKSIINSEQSTHHYDNDVNAAGVWNDFEMRWKKVNELETVAIYVNQVIKKTYSNKDISNLRLDVFSAHNIILNLNIGSDGNIFQNKNNNVFDRSEMLIDYVKVQKRSI